MWRGPRGPEGAVASVGMPTGCRTEAGDGAGALTAQSHWRLRGLHRTSQALHPSRGRAPPRAAPSLAPLLWALQTQVSWGRTGSPQVPGECWQPGRAARAERHRFGGSAPQQDKHRPERHVLLRSREGLRAASALPDRSAASPTPGSPPAVRPRELPPPRPDLPAEGWPRA